jgi:ribosomal protein L11 methyltransferase
MLSPSTDNKEMTAKRGFIAAMSDWSCLEFSVPASSIEAVSAILWEFGTQGIEEVETAAKWSRLKAYFLPESRIKKLQEEFIQICHDRTIPVSQLEIHQLENRDWLREWRASLKPFPAGKKFFIIPIEQNNYLPPPRKIQILLEPGMAFGTGTHETTQLCLEAIERFAQPGCSLLDIGTGSGILAMAACKLGAKRVVACDIDPIALEVARANAKINQCNKIEWNEGDNDSVGNRRFDLAIANLTIEPIEKSFFPMEKRVKRGGWLILSGILKDQVKRLAPLIPETSLRRIQRRSRNEWICLILQRIRYPI